MSIFSPKPNVIKEVPKGFTGEIKLPGLDITPTVREGAPPKIPETTQQASERYPISAVERARRLGVAVAAMDEAGQINKQMDKELRDAPAKVLNTETDISATLAERGSRYGLFKTHASVTQAYKAQTAQALRDSGVILSPDQQEALDMIHHKIGRIVNGDPNYADSWIDIAGYAKLISDRLEMKGEYAPDKA